jgi:predicted molibdopterin-dependent oxidoreductase YjgC
MLAGGVKALVVVGDNPVMHSHNRDGVEAALKGLDSLVVIDSLPTETVKLASVALADLSSYSKDGTYTNADRRVLRLSRGEAPIGDQRDAIELLGGLAAAVSRELGNAPQAMPSATAASVMETASLAVDGYVGAHYDRIESGVTRALPASATMARLQAVSTAVPASNGRLLLTTARTLYTSLEGASILSEEADKLHREEFLEINPTDAAALGIGQNRPVTVSNGTQTLELSAALTDAVAAGSVFLPLYYQGGIVNRLLPADGSPALVTVRPA